MSGLVRGETPYNLKCFSETQRYNIGPKAEGQAPRAGCVKADDKSTVKDVCSLTVLYLCPLPGVQYFNCPLLEGYINIYRSVLVEPCFRFCAYSVKNIKALACKRQIFRAFSAEGKATVILHKKYITVKHA